MTGELAILNVGAGDTKLSFDPKSPAEVERSKKIVLDMIRRGFVILIEIGRDDKGPIYRRALDFDPETAEYIVAGDPVEEARHEETEPLGSPPAKRKAPARRETGKRRIPASSASAVGVSRTSGG